MFRAVKTRKGRYITSTNIEVLRRFILLYKPKDPDRHYFILDLFPDTYGLLEVW